MINEVLKDHWLRVKERMDYTVINDEYWVFSFVLNSYFYGPTLTSARHNRSEAERVYREHHAKNSE